MPRERQVLREQLVALAPWARLERLVLREALECLEELVELDPLVRREQRERQDSPGQRAHPVGL